MDDNLANHLIGLYEKGLEELGVEIEDVKYGARGTKLLVKIKGELKEYSATVGGGTVLDSHVAVLRQAYWETKEAMKTKLTYKDIYKQ